MSTTISALTAANSIDATQDYFPIVTNNINTTQKINRNTFLNIASQPVGLTDTQSLNNKTLDNTNTITLKDTLFTIQDDGNATKQVKFNAVDVTAGQTRTFRFPDTSDILVTESATQGLANKNIISPTISSPTITNATISADAITGYSASTTGTIYGISVTTGTIGSAALASNSVTTSAITDNNVTASKLATNAIKLGYASATVNQGPISNNSAIQVTSLSVTVTIPAGSRYIRISALLPNITNTVSATNLYLSLWDGTVGSGTQLQEVLQTPGASAYLTSLYAVAIVTPAAGTKTYNAGFRVGQNAATIQNGATSPAFILVEAI